MYNNEDIYSRLLAGESSDVIAAEMTKALNEALDRIAAEKAQALAEEERKMREAAEREAKNTAKREHLADIITETLYFCAEFYPSLGITTEEVDQMSDETIDALADMFLMLLDVEVSKKNRQSLHNTLTFPFHMSKITDTAKPAEPVSKKPSNDDIFASFFKSFM